ncbi:MAG TPA: AAA family ATPase [Clostridiales bacterium]|nr:AAA family ATPase [Clostridiales bacterium]
MEVKPLMMKKLTRIRLINWHFFTNETISVNGSFLITGENTSGKSTILDAIQLVLTTNTRKFNTAANEKSNRDLKGYVRCKTGDEERAYLREGSVITYVALEFYEEKRNQYFTIGVKIDSADDESRLNSKWFCEECKLDSLSFLTDGRPSMTGEFRKDDRKVSLISQVSEAKLRFARRLGNLEERFFDIIPKSLAFKPMDKVKDFINKFLLSEKNIEVSALRKNINLLKEFENLMEITKEKTKSLEEILNKHDELEMKDREIRINDILIKKAEIEDINDLIALLDKEIHIYKRQLEEEKIKEKEADQKHESENNRLSNLQIAHANNEITKLINDTENDIKSLNKDKDYLSEKLKKLKGMVTKLIETLSLLSKYDEVIATKEQILNFLNTKIDISKNRELVYDLKINLNNYKETYTEKFYVLRSQLDKALDKRLELENEIKDLKNKKLSYPNNTKLLKNAIEEEFRKRDIDSPVRIFSDLLEITDPRWQNAIEGYLNNQRFYIIVEPNHYKIALNVYHRIRKEVHSVGLINTGKLKLDIKTNPESLAYVITSDNIFAKSYANYLLNRIVRCENIDQLKDHNIAITFDCFLYQNFAVRRIYEKVYSTPFIGAHAYKVQLELKEKEYNQLIDKIKMIKDEETKYKSLTRAIEFCNMDVIDENIEVPVRIEKVISLIEAKQTELKMAKSNPNYIEIQIEIESCKKQVKRYREDHYAIRDKTIELKKDIEFKEKEVEERKEDLNRKKYYFDQVCEEDTLAMNEGMKKYDEQRRTKLPATIVSNFSPHRKGLENRKQEFSDELIRLQSHFCSAYDCDLGTGPESILIYKAEHHKLESSEIVKYEDELRKAKYNCEIEFKESFLARLRENIESAKIEFKSLNKSLKGIYYGEDSYKFDISYNKKKESLYKMIVSEQNIGGFTLWSNSFEEEYKDEMNDLFEKLTAHDDLGDKVIEEYTDYRTYLDYDIIVEKKDGSILKFSNIYGEKSGGETQTPYYVSIAASFVQLYKLGDTIRIIMLDEAFDKMDDNRIASMMDFFNSQNFQIIIATPPSKMEVIGEKVDTILITMREGNHSIVEVYDYDQ